MTRVRRTLILGFLAVVAAVTSLSAQQPRPTFRTAVDVVRLDVTVLDKDRRPIRDLKREDFTILVDGTEQPIVAFDEVVLPSVDSSHAAWTREIGSDVRTNELAEPRLFILLMDDLSTPQDPWMGNTGRQVANAIVDQMLPSDLAAVVFTFSTRHNQELTSDRAKLRRAIETFRPQCCLHPMVAGRMAQSTLKNVFAAVRQRQIPGRSALMWISPGPPSLGGGNVSTAGQGLLGEMESPFDLVTWANEVAGEARVSNLPVYGFSIAGLMAPGGQPTNPVFAQISSAFTYKNADIGNEIMRGIANMTGGRSVVNTNAPVKFVPGVINELGAYYVVGYRTTYPMNDRKTRRLRIKVNRPDAYVVPNGRTLRPAVSRARRSGSSKDAPMLESAMSDILPKRDIPLKIAIAPVATQTKNRAGVAITLGVRQPGPDEPQTEEVDVLTRVFTPDGHPVTRTTQKATVKWAGSGEAQYEILSLLDLKPGRYLVRTSAHSPARQKTASVYTDITVPDFRKERLSLSGVVVSAMPSPRSAPHDAVAGVLPVVPTAERDFHVSQRAEVLVRVHQGGKHAPAPVAVKATIVSERGEQVLEKDGTLAAETFGAQRAVDYRLVLPLNTLTPGAYLLTLTATSGEKDLRRADVRFTVRR